MKAHALYDHCLQMRQLVLCLTVRALSGKLCIRELRLELVMDSRMLESILYDCLELRCGRVRACHDL